MSALEGTGIGELKAVMVEKICGALPDEDSQGVAVSARHHALLNEASAALDEALALYARGAESAAVFCAQSLRTAAEALGKITGRVYSDDLLDVIFSRFCIGK